MNTEFAFETVTASEILTRVFEAGAIETDVNDPEGRRAEVEAEVEFLANELIERGEYKGTAEDAVNYALGHVEF